MQHDVFFLNHQKTADVVKRIKFENNNKIASDEEIFIQIGQMFHKLELFKDWKLRDTPKTYTKDPFRHEYYGKCYKNYKTRFKEMNSRSGFIKEKPQGDNFYTSSTLSWNRIIWSTWLG